VTGPVGVIAIGRNEGERLASCLASAVASQCRVVYVDSGSSDGSVELARRLGALVVELPASLPFTAARARNAGFEALRAAEPDLELVQFVDGDCELDRGWIAQATSYLAGHARTAAVCGRRRERYPTASPYHRVIDLEWDTPVGSAVEFGGDVMIRSEVFCAVGGYDPSLIAGEDPDLAWRIRAAGWELVRLPHEMTLHDAAMSHFSQWWRRSIRSGYAYAEAAWRHRRGPERHQVRETLSILTWGLALPVLALLLAPATRGLSLALLVALLASLSLRIWFRRILRGDSTFDSALYATACVLGKFAASWGALRFAVAHGLMGSGSRIIEYKEMPRTRR
jgi:GT2 family glycosyltransferase